MQPQRSETNGEPGRPDPGAHLPAAVRLAACIAAIVALWLGVLPIIGETPRVRGDVERNESLGIDPSAKFYSELPAMPRIADEIEGIRRRDGGAFW